MSSARVAAFALIAAALSSVALQPACAEIICPACEDARLSEGNGGSSAGGGVGANGASGGNFADVSLLTDARPEAAPPLLLDAPPDAPPPLIADAPDAPVSGRPRYVGVHPNYFGASDAARSLTHEKAHEARLNALGSAYPWIDALYTSSPTCVTASCPPCDNPVDCYWTRAVDVECRPAGYSQLRCEYEKFFDAWLAGASLPEDRVVLVDIAISTLGDWHVGPRFLWPLQTTPNDIHGNATVSSFFQDFYDQLYEIMNQEKYGSGTRWILTLNGPANCPAELAVSDSYLEFHRKARAYIREVSARPRDGGPNVVPTVGVSIPFFSEECDGLWDLATGEDSAATAELLKLSAEAEAIVFVYDAMDSANEWRALSPERVGDDIARMKAFRDQVAADAGRRPELIIGGTSYGTHDSLHGSTDAGSTDAGYSPYPNGEEAQRILVQNLIAELSDPPEDFVGFFWGLLLDVGDPQSVPCVGFASLFDSVAWAPYGAAGFRAAACTSGLIDWLGSDKPAWDELVNWY